MSNMRAADMWCCPSICTDTAILDILPAGDWWKPENNANGMYDAVKMMATLPFVDREKSASRDIPTARSQAVPQSFSTMKPRNL